MRLFLGFPVDGPTRSALKEWQQLVVHPSDGFRWMAIDAWHITALFIGEVPEEDYKPLLDRLPSPGPAFTLSFDQIRIIKRKGLASMVWAQYQRCVYLSELYQRLHAALSPIVELAPRQDHIVPHITLARIQTRKRIYPITWPTIAVPNLTCHRLHLYRSHLHATGATYETLATFPLR